MANAPDTTTSLGELFTHYGSDKTRNGYHSTYQDLFTDRYSVTAVLEVGVGTLNPAAHSSMVGYAAPHYKPGGSLRAWRDYFPNAFIIGIDIQPDAQVNEDRIRTLQADSTKPDQLETLGNFTFDLIVDDGDHTTQILTLNNLWHRVKLGGYYAIEDIANPDGRNLLVMQRA